MARDVATVRLDAEKRAALDALASATDRGRNHLINEAIDAYLGVHRRQIAHIAKCVRQAEVGDFATDGEVAAAFERWR